MCLAGKEIKFEVSCMNHLISVTDISYMKYLAQNTVPNGECEKNYSKCITVSSRESSRIYLASRVDLGYSFSGIKKYLPGTLELCVGGHS